MVASGRAGCGATTAKKVHQAKSAVVATYPIGMSMKVPPSTLGNFLGFRRSASPSQVTHS